MKKRAWVSCLVGSSWVLACGSEPPSGDPPESAPEDEVVVIATADALTSAAAGTTNGSGGSPAAAGTSAATSGSSGSRSTSAASSASAAGGGATDGSTTTQPGASGAAGASAAPEGSGSDSGGAGAAASADPVSTTSGTSEGAGGGEPTTTTGEVLPPPPIPVGALLITEYVESGPDKAIEISNLGPQSLSLTECRLETYFNGNLESTSGVDLAVDLEPGQSWVLCNSPEHAALLAICDQPSSVNFNGNDALVLRCDGVVHDSFGQVGGPGEAWQSSEAADTESYSSEDHVLRRRCGALPRTDPLMPFEPALTIDWVSVWQIEGVIRTGEEFEGLGQSTCAERAPADEQGEGGRGGADGSEGADAASSAADSASE